MKVSHIFSKSSLHHVIPFTIFINDYLDCIDGIHHEVIIQPEQSSDSYEGELDNLKVDIKFTTSVDELLHIVGKASNIHLVIFHGLYDRKLVNKLVYKINKLKYVSWFIWGADLYSKPNRRLKRWVNFCCRKIVFSRIGTKLSLLGDFKELQERYGCKSSEFVEMLFPAWFYLEIEKLQLASKEKTEAPSSVIVGNSAAESNNYYELIDKLKSMEQLEVFTFILNYGGSKCYVEKVKAYAKQELGRRRLVFIEDPLNYSDFLRLVREHDMLAYNHYRQQGIGTLNIAIHFELSVFVRSDCATFNSYADWGIQLGDTNEIGTSSYLEVSSDIASKNKEILRGKFHPESCASRFNAFFQSKLGKS